MKPIVVVRSVIDHNLADGRTRGPRQVQPSACTLTVRRPLLRRVPRIAPDLAIDRLAGGLCCRVLTASRHCCYTSDVIAVRGGGNTSGIVASGCICCSTRVGSRTGHCVFSLHPIKLVGALTRGCRRADSRVKITVSIECLALAGKCVGRHRHIHGQVSNPISSKASHTPSLCSNSRYCKMVGMVSRIIIRFVVLCAD